MGGVRTESRTPACPRLPPSLQFGEMSPSERKRHRAAVPRCKTSAIPSSADFSPRRPRLPRNPWTAATGNVLFPGRRRELEIAPWNPRLLRTKPQRTEEEFQHIVLEQMPQVKYIARRIHEHLPQHVPFEDLLQAGMVGLIDALNKFDSDKNVKFASYAKFRIRGAILDSLREWTGARETLRRKSRQIDTVVQKLQTELGRKASEPEMAKALGLSLDEFQALTNEIRGLEISSLQCESTEDGQETDLAQNIPGPPDEDPLTLCVKGEMEGRLQKRNHEVAGTRTAGAHAVLPAGTDHAGGRRADGRG